MKRWALIFLVAAVSLETYAWAASDELREKSSLEQNEREFLTQPLIKNQGKTSEQEQALQKLKGQLSKSRDDLWRFYEKNGELVEKIHGYKKELAGVYFQLGSYYTQEKFYAKAIDAYKRSIDYDSSLNEVYYNLGLLYEYAYDDSETALNYFKTYLKLETAPEKRKKVEGIVRIIK